ncbi:MAG: hypothetical protein FLDDKLPJ_00010 [Phycisphaerae bacterium]|nr:hypothetical protein [Phycisphaerae bacterium]
MSDSCLPPGIAEPLLAAMTTRQLLIFFAGLALVFIVLRSHRRKSRAATEKAITRSEARVHRKAPEATAEYDAEALLRCERYVREAQGEIRSLMALLHSSFRSAGGTAKTEKSEIEQPPSRDAQEPAPNSSESQTTRRKELRARAAELAGQGRTPRQTASLLGCSAGEVELALLAGRQSPATGASRDATRERGATSTSAS